MYLNGQLLSMQSMFYGKKKKKNKGVTFSMETNGQNYYPAVGFTITQSYAKLKFK